MEVHGDVSLGSVSHQTADARYRITEGSHAPGCELPLHAHRASNLTVVLQGAFREQSSSGSVDCAPGSVLYKGAYLPHRNRYGREGAMVLHLEPLTPYSGAALLMAALAPSNHGVMPRVPPALSNLLASFKLDRKERRVLDRCLAGGRRLVAPRWARDICRRLLTDSAEPVNLETLAREYAISRSQLTRGFRRSYACSIGEFQRRIRLERAAELLTGSELPIAAIAGACGFSDQAHLCRLFRRRTGRSPGGFRREVGMYVRNR